MFGRFITMQGSPSRLEDAIRLIENDVIPAAKLLPGFTGGYWCADRKTGKTVTLTFWETEKAMLDSETAAGQIRKNVAEKLGAEVKNVERYEVIAHV